MIDGQRIYSLRRNLGWTQGQVAQRARISSRRVGQLENGIVRNPRVATVVALARALKTTIEDLLDQEAKE